MLSIMIRSPYLWGIVALICMYLLSLFGTRSRNPFYLARGHNGQFSTSLFQNLIFTILTVFAYVTVVAARFIDSPPGEPLPALPAVPINLLVLMGLSITTSTTSKAIAITSQAEGKSSAEDKSTLLKDRDDKFDLTKAQMLIWALVAVGVYLVVLYSFISAKCYLGVNVPDLCPKDAALPDIDAAFLVLMGVSQGTYVAGKLVSRTAAKPLIEHILPTEAKAKEQVSIEGHFFGEGKDGNSLILKKDEASGAEAGIPMADIKDWKETKILFEVPDTLASGKYILSVRSGGQTGDGKDFEVTQENAK